MKEALKFALFFLVICVGISISPDQCCKTINLTNFPTQYCDLAQNVCNFTEGIMKMTSSVGNQYFRLCIVLDNFTINIGPNIKDQEPDYSHSIYIQARNINFLYNYTMFNDYQIVAVGLEGIQTANLTFLSAMLVWFDAPWINVNFSRIQNMSSIQSDCSCADQSAVGCKEKWDLNFVPLWSDVNATQQVFNISIFATVFNYTSIKHNSIILYGRDLIQITQSSLFSSVIGIFAKNVTITDKTAISTTGNGFPSATGFGCGYFDQILNQLLGCTGSGGSYGGFGGNSWPDNCNLMISRPPYELNEYPSSPGSGGGFLLQGLREASSGGGIINIQGETIDIWNSSVEANGRAGAQGGGGGGSGGSVALDYFVIAGNSNISADGGNGKSSGGGGRLWLWNHNWRYQKYNAYLSQFRITANGGGECLQQLSCGQSGSITTSPCQPGFQLDLKNFICKSCQPGFYQSQYGYTRCEPCLNKPANSNYNQSKGSSMFKYGCNYTCDAGYDEVNGDCLTNFISIINTVGGVNMLISAGIIVCAIIVYLIIVLFQKLTEKELFNQKKQLYLSQQQRDHLERRMHFRVEDIPFHEKRIYFSGDNTPRKPWHISEQTKEAYKRHALAPITKLQPILNKLCKEIAVISKYSKRHSIFMSILKVFYYPLWRYIEQLYKVQKSELIEKLVIQTNKKIPEAQNLAIKFHVQPFCSIGCLEIFNYNKSALDFYIQNYFPIYFQLQKMPLGGYAIDLNDPFMKAFISQIDQKDIKSMESENYIHSNRVYEKYINELDELLRNTEQLIPILNHLWMMTQYNPSIQVYLYQHGNKILGVQTCYSISSKHPLFLVFSSENSNKYHFVSEEPLKNIYHHSVQYFNNQYKFRQEVSHEDKKSVFWEIQNTINEKVLSWSLGILTIFILLQVVIQFFILIFVQAQKQVQFTYGMVVYFAIFPFSEFFSVYLCFRLILSKNCKILADSLYFTLGNIFKFLVIIILGMIGNISTDFSNILMELIFYLWILSLVSNIVSMFLKLLLHWHYSRHRGQNGQNILQIQKKLKLN